jgi:undecaprenyl-diphosphatase
METIIEFDKSILYFVNHTMHHPYLDVLFYWITNKWIWIPLYAYILYFLYITQTIKIFIADILSIVILIILSDQLASGICKPLFERLRPCHDPSINYMLYSYKDICGGTYGFVSSHASNTMAIFLYLIGNKKITAQLYIKLLFVWVLLVSFSRVYLGVHYLGDILGGFIVAIVASYLTIKIETKGLQYFKIH